MRKILILLTIAALVTFGVVTLGVAAFASNHKVTICHIPPGNPDNAHTIEISENAVDAHLAHGDTLGACVVVDPDPDPDPTDPTEPVNPDPKDPKENPNPPVENSPEGNPETPQIGTAKQQTAEPEPVEVPTVVDSGLEGVLATGSEISCDGPHYSTDYRYVTEPTFGLPDAEWRVMHELKYRHCKEGIRHWADPMSIKYGCREANNAANFSGLRDVTFNSRMWDRDHHEVNPGPQTIECNRDDWNTKLIYFDGMSRFHRCWDVNPGGPRIDTHVELDIPADTNPTTRLSGGFWGFTGPTWSDC